MRNETIRTLIVLLIPSGVLAAGETSNRNSPIDLPLLIETFMVAPGVKPDWAMGAGLETPQLGWVSAGVEGKPACGAYEACWQRRRVHFIQPAVY